MGDKERRAYLMAQLVILRERVEKVGPAASLLDQAEIVQAIALLSIAYDLARLSDGDKFENTF
jgi:hypothetical protein